MSMDGTPGARDLSPSPPQELVVVVRGEPAPQGSKKAVGRAGNGRALLVESSAKVKPWREAVKHAVFDACGLSAQFLGGVSCITGAVKVAMTFTMRRPQSAKRDSKPFHRPDIDKLCRSTLDSLVMSGIIEDDSRVVELSAAKVFPGEGVDSLPAPGAVIRIRSS